MKTTNQAAELVGQYSGMALEALGLWADANQRIIREVADLSTSTAKEGIELCARLQSSALTAAQEGHERWSNRLRDLATWQGDPMEWYRASLLEGIQETRNGLKLFEDNLKAVNQTSERLHAANRKAAEEIGRAFTSLASGGRRIRSASRNQ